MFLSFILNNLRGAFVSYECLPGQTDASHCKTGMPNDSSNIGVQKLPVP